MNNEQLNSSVETKYQKVGGWLLLLCIMLTVMSMWDLANLEIYFLNLDRYFFDTYGMKIWVGIILLYVLPRFSLSLFSFFAGISLWRIKPKAVKYTLIYFWTASIYATATILDLWNKIWGQILYPDARWGWYPKDFEPIWASGRIGSLGLLIFVTIWSFYLGKSKRVKNTFG